MRKNTKEERSEAIKESSDEQKTYHFKVTLNVNHFILRKQSFLCKDNTIAL